MDQAFADGQFAKPGGLQLASHVENGKVQGVVSSKLFVSCREVRRGTNRDLVERSALENTTDGRYRIRT